jgi:hypothetical protein
MAKHLRPVKAIAVAVRRSTYSGPRRNGRTTVTVLLQEETYLRLLEPAQECARGYGLAETDQAWHEQVAEHIGRALEDAFARTFLTGMASPLAADSARAEVSLACDTAKALQRHARDLAEIKGIRDPKLLVEAEWHYVGRSLEAALRAQQATREVADSDKLDDAFEPAS